MELTENKALECKEYNEEILGETKIDDKIVFTKENLINALNGIAEDDISISETEKGTRVKVSDTIFLEEYRPN